MFYRMPPPATAKATRGALEQIAQLAQLSAMEEAPHRALAAQAQMLEGYADELTRAEQAHALAQTRLATLRLTVDRREGALTPLRELCRLREQLDSYYSLAHYLRQELNANGVAALRGRAGKLHTECGAPQPPTTNKKEEWSTWLGAVMATLHQVMPSPPPHPSQLRSRIAPLASQAHHSVHHSHCPLRLISS